jgi:hypothetical protein
MMAIDQIIAMTSAYKLGLLLVVLFFSLVPLAIFDANPGLGVGGWIQLIVIVLVVALTVVRFARRRTRARLVCAALSYPWATVTTNVFGLALIPDLMH